MLYLGDFSPLLISVEDIFFANITYDILYRSRKLNIIVLN